MRAILGDWQASLIYQWQSGFPFTISVFGDTANAGSLLNVNPIRANVVPGVSPEIEHPNADMWFDTAAFAVPAPFTFGTATRNSVWGPGLKKADLALDRELPLAGRTTFHFRLEAFNLFNTVNYGTPNRFVNTPQFGTLTEAPRPRARFSSYSARRSNSVRYARSRLLSRTCRPENCYSGLLRTHSSLKRACLIDLPAGVK